MASELIGSLERATGIVTIQEVDGSRLDRSRAEQSIAEDDNIRAMQDAFGATVKQDSVRPRD